MSRKELAHQWQQRLHDCAQSGRSVVDWCYYNKVTVPQYYYWKRRLAAQAPASPTTTALVPVALLETDPPLAPSATGVSLRLAGTTIEVAHDFDPATLRAVVVALSSLPC